MSLKHWLRDIAVVNRRVAERRQLRGFTATYDTGSEVRQSIIHDISATGIFLETSDRWETQASVPLTLHRIVSPTAESAAPFVNLKARVVRCTEDGVAFAFEMPSNVDRLLWTNLVDSATYESESDDIVAPFKMAKALAFLTRICTPHGTQVRQRVRANLTGQRLWNAVEMLLQAEDYLAARPDGGDPLCDPSLALRILEEGSWTEDESMMHDWAGLLATACLSGKNDAASRTFVEIFGQLTPTHVRILFEACRRGTKYFDPDGQLVSRPLTANSDDIMHFSDTRDLLRVARSLQHLCELGLIEERVKSSMLLPVEGVGMTPTNLGLQLFARCNGYCGPLESFYKVTRTAELASAG
jgi:hypothetical protein